jgi:DNA-binding transcriptional LysR family regulator
MHQLRYFLAVADAVNFTRAAQQCNVSQPALTRDPAARGRARRAIAAARTETDYLTDFGRLIQPHLRQVLADAEAAKTTAKRF